MNSHMDSHVAFKINYPILKAISAACPGKPRDRHSLILHLIIC